MEKKLMGVFAPISTPFTADGRVDYEGLAQNVKRYAAAGLKGYLALGSNGENKSLSNAEKLREQGRGPDRHGRLHLRVHRGDR